MFFTGKILRVRFLLMLPVYLYYVFSIAVLAHWPHVHHVPAVQKCGGDAGSQAESPILQMDSDGACKVSIA